MRSRASSTFPRKEISVREIRKKLGLSQDDFAAEFGFTINQIRDWETGTNSAAWRFASVLDAHQKRPAGRIAAVTQ